LRWSVGHRLSLSIGIALVEGTVLSYLLHRKAAPNFCLRRIDGLVAVIFIGMAYAARGTGGAVASRKGTTICVISGC